MENQYFMLQMRKLNDLRQLIKEKEVYLAFLEGRIEEITHKLNQARELIY